MHLANPANALMIQINSRAAAWMQRRVFSFHKARRMRRKQGLKIALHIKKVNQTRRGTPSFFPSRSVSEGARHQRLSEIRNVECIRGDRRVGVKYAPRFK